MRKKVLSILLSLSVIIGCAAQNVSFAYAETASDIEVGDYMQLGTYFDQSIIWRCVDIDETNGPLMLSDKILCVKAYDGNSYGSTAAGSHLRGYASGDYRQGRDGGSNYWGDSNIRSWLNSTAEAGKVEWDCGNEPTASHIIGSSYGGYEDEAGFLNKFTTSELAAIKEVTQKSLLDGYEYNSTTADSSFHVYNSSIDSVLQNYDEAYSENVTDKVFLLDVKQVYDMYENLGDYYYDAHPTEEAIDDINLGMASNVLSSTDGTFPYWLRTPATKNGSTVLNSVAVRSVNTDGSVAYISTANQGYKAGIRPAFYLNDIEFSQGDGSADNPFAIDTSGDTEDTVLTFTDADGNSQTAEITSAVKITPHYPSANTFYIRVDTNEFGGSGASFLDAVRILADSKEVDTAILNYNYTDDTQQYAQFPIEYTHSSSSSAVTVRALIKSKDSSNADVYYVSDSIAVS